MNHCIEICKHCGAKDEAPDFSGKLFKSNYTFECTRCGHSGEQRDVVERTMLCPVCDKPIVSNDAEPEKEEPGIYLSVEGQLGKTRIYLHAGCIENVGPVLAREQKVELGRTGMHFFGRSAEWCKQRHEALRRMFG